MTLNVFRMRGVYPRQYWLLFWGYMISTIGQSMIWPFLVIYVSEKLHQPLTAVTSLMTINAVTGLAFSFFSGPVVDRAGRKWVMVVSLLVSGLVYFFYSRAASLLAFAVLQAISGAFNPLYRVAADAMMADLIPSDQRLDAYALMRLGHNMGVAIGPAMGGFIAASSYSMAFYFAMAGMTLFAVLVAIFAVETLPAHAGQLARQEGRFGGYDRVVRDRPFLYFALSFTLTQVPATILWVLLAVYAKRNFGIPESLYGLIPTTNAVMVLLLQLWVTRVSKTFPPLKALAAGALIYGLALGSIALGRGFWWFWATMVFYTVGEMILMPTATTYTANLAPADMRGRYMSVYTLSWGAASGIGPVLGGFLNDTLGPRSPWVGAMVIGLLSAAAFLLLSRHPDPRAVQQKPAL